MHPVGRLLASLPGRAPARIIGGLSIAFGVSFAVFVLVEAYSPYQGGVFEMVVTGTFQGVLPGVAFVVVGVWAIREPMELGRAIGAAAGALSGPLYYPFLYLGHPNDSGADMGRGFVLMVMLALLAVNVRIGASVGERAGRWRVGVGDIVYDALGPERMRPLARAVGLGAVATALLILWLAHAETSPTRESPTGSSSTTGSRRLSRLASWVS